MPDKKLILLSLLAFLSIILGGFLGALDFYGFVNGQHTINIWLLLMSLSIIYFATILVFILDFAQKQDLGKAYLFVSFFFAITFFIVTRDPLLTLGFGLIYFTFLLFTYQQSLNRSRLFVKFNPKEIFFPVLKNGFLYIFMLLAFLAFFQTRSRVSQQTLVNPRIVQTISKPITILISTQLNTQIKAQMQESVPADLPPEQKRSLVRSVINETVKSATQNNQTLFGFEASEIPAEKIAISPDGQIDVAPLIEAMSPVISRRLNEKIQTYAIFAPFVIALFVVLVLQPFMLPIQLLEAGLTALIFKVLISTGIITIKKEAGEIERISL